MARIPEFETRQLASSAVGTPGVDKSQEMLWTSAANAAKGVEDSALALSKRRQEAQDQMLAAKTSLEQQRQMEEMTIKHNEQYANSDVPIEQQQAEYDKKAKEIQTNLMGTLASPGARYRFELTGSEYAGNAAIKQLRTADRNRAILAHKTTVTELDKTSMDIADLGSNTALTFEEKKAQIEEKLKLADQLIVGPHLTPEDSANLAKAKPEMMAKAYAATAMLTNPAEVIQMIDSGVFGKELSPVVASQLKEEALKALPAFKERAELMAALGDGKTFSGVLQKISAGDSKAAAIELANMPDSTQKRVFQQQLYRTKLNVENDPYQQARLQDRFLQLEVDSKTKTAKANALDIIEYMTDVSQTATNGGINKKTFDSLLATAVVPFLAKIGDEQPALANEHATGWRSVKRFFGLDEADPTGKTPQAVEVYNDFATILSQQPKISSETVTSSLQQALGNYARKTNPELAFLTEMPDAAMRPNGVPDKVGVGSQRKADISEKSEPLVTVRNPATGKTKAVPESQVAKLIAAGAERV